MVALTVEARTDGPCPLAGVTVTGLLAGDQVITVWRTADGERRAVRGARAVPVLDSHYVEDYEVPLGRTVLYELEVLAGADYGAQGVEATVTVESECGYVQDPLDPASAVPVWGSRRPGGQAALRPSSFSKISYGSSGSTHTVMGSSRPVAISGMRRAAAGIPLEMVTRAEVENDRMRALVKQAPQLIIRPLPDWRAGLPGSATYLAETVEEEPRRSMGAHTTWTTAGDIVRGSSARVLISLWTYQDVAELFATYGQKQLAAGGGTYLEDQKNPANS